MTRKRFSTFCAQNLEDILYICDRHIQNVTEMQISEAIEGVNTKKDDFYCKLIRSILSDLREDVAQMIEQQKTPAYETILTRFRSGEMRPVEFLKHMQDPLFVDWYYKDDKVA